jgi:hypothetical protein
VVKNFFHEKKKKSVKTKLKLQTIEHDSKEKNDNFLKIKKNIMMLKNGRRPIRSRPNRFCPIRFLLYIYVEDQFKDLFRKLGYEVGGLFYDRKKKRPLDAYGTVTGGLEVYAGRDNTSIGDSIFFYYLFICCLCCFYCLLCSIVFSESDKSSSSSLVNLPTSGNARGSFFFFV